MKNLTFIKSISTIFGVLLFLLSMLVSPVSFAAGAVDTDRRTVPEMGRA